MSSPASPASTIAVIVAIPTHQRAEHLALLLADLAQQSDTTFRLSIMNDGGDAATAALVARSRPVLPHMHLVESTKRLGLPAARNALLDAIAAGEVLPDATYIAWLDDDVRIDRHFIATVKHYARSCDGFCFRLQQEGPATTFDLTQHPWLHRLFRPLLGRFIPALGILFGGFYLAHSRPRRVQHLNGGCLIYNLSRNQHRRFDERLGSGSAVAEDTCFSYGLHRAGMRLWHIGNYTYIHRPPAKGGCKVPRRADAFYWYWKHKLYVTQRYHGRWTVASAVLCSAVESVALSLLLTTNLFPPFWRAVRSYA